MKMKALLMAGAAALGAVSGQALALPPTDVPGLEVNMSGSSSQLLTISALASGLFEPATYDVYYNNAVGGHYRAFFGTIKAGIHPALTGKKVLMRYRAAGGSVWGVNPVARADLIPHMNLASCGPRVAMVPNYTCPGTILMRSDIGVSDVEPAMFVGINVANGDSELTITERSRLTVYSAYAVIFGVAVNDAVTAALAGSGITSLSRDTVTSMLTSTAPFTDWSAHDSMNSALAMPVVVCRRVDGAGTQATFNNYFAGFPCTSAPGLLADRTSSVNYMPPGSPNFNYTANSYTVIENSTSSDVRNCLNKAQTGGTVTQSDGAVVTLPAQSLAIGMLSTENQRVGGDQWDYIKMDGELPTKVLATGCASCGKLWTEQTFQHRNVTVCNGGTHIGAAAHLPPCHAGETTVAFPSGLLATFLDTFMARAADPAIIGPLPGVAALAYVDPSLYPPGQVMRATRLGNTCSHPKLYWGCK